MSDRKSPLHLIVPSGVALRSTCDIEKCTTGLDDAINLANSLRKENEREYTIYNGWGEIVTDTTQHQPETTTPPLCP